MSYWSISLHSLYAFRILHLISKKEYFKAYEEASRAIEYAKQMSITPVERNRIRKKYVHIKMLSNLHC